MTEKILPTGRCHACNTAVKGTFLYCYICNKTIKQVDSFVEQRTGKMNKLVNHRLEVTFEYPTEFVTIRCCVVVTPDLAIQAFKGEYPNIGLVFDDWFREVVQRKVNVLTVHEIPVTCERCDKPASVIIETTRGTQQTKLCSECKDIVLTTHTRTIWKIKETIQQEETKKDSSLENTL